MKKSISNICFVNYPLFWILNVEPFIVCMAVGKTDKIVMKSKYILKKILRKKAYISFCLFVFYKPLPSNKQIFDRYNFVINMRNSFHKDRSQSTFPPVIEHLKSAYKQWIAIERNLPKCERFGLGQRVDLLFCDLLDILQKASFSPIEIKISLLSESLTKIDSLRFFIQLCWELKLIPPKQFTVIGEAIEDIGKMVGGWRKGLITKTSAVTEEKN